MPTASQSKPELKRCPEWPKVLAAFVDEYRGKPFAWGSHDCCMTAAEWVRTCTGHDAANSYRGKYRSELGAMKLLKRDGGVRGIASACLPSVPVNFAHRGDLVAYQDVSRQGPAWARTSLGILTGAVGLFPNINGGFTEVPRDKLMKTAWRVGRT